MRTIDPADLALLQSGVRSLRHKAEVQDEAGTWIDVTPFFRSFSWTENRDAEAASGTARLRREAMIGGVLTSLAPLVTSSYNEVGGSYSPLLNPFRGWRFSSAVGAAGAVPDAGDLVVVFQGVIDDPSWGGRQSVIELGVRDLAAPLQDALIEEERVYGSEAGTPIEDVLQAILDDNGFSALTVQVLGDTEGWSLRPYTQARGVSPWAACRALALQMGWDFRYWWHSDGTYAPTLLEPSRDTSSPTITFTQAQFTDLPKLRLNGTDVRNAGELRYFDTAAGGIQVVTAEDAGSIAAYGRRPFGMEESAASNIDTEEEAQQFIDAAVADMATPYVEQDARHPYLWPLQLGDVLAYPAVATHYTDAQAFGLVGIRHEVTTEAAWSVPVLRGRPVGAYQRWLALLRKQALTRYSGPSPLISPPLADGNVDGGTSLDGGAIWYDIEFEERTDAVEAYTATGPTAPLDAPPRENNWKSHDIRRPEKAAANWSTLIRQVTHVGYARRTQFQPYGFLEENTRRVGRTITREGVAATGFSATMGAVTVTVERDVTSSVLSFTADACSSPYDVYLLIWRDGVNIARIPWAASGTYTDEDVPSNEAPVYAMQSWTTDGTAYARSGALSNVRREPVDEAPAPAIDPPTWSAGYPRAVGIEFGDSFMRAGTSIRFTSTDPSAEYAVLEEATGKFSWAVVWVSPNITPGVEVVSGLIPGLNGWYYRIVTKDNVGATREVSTTERAVRSSTA